MLSVSTYTQKQCVTSIFIFADSDWGPVWLTWLRLRKTPTKWNVHNNQFRITTGYVGELGVLFKPKMYWPIRATNWKIYWLGRNFTGPIIMKRICTKILLFITKRKTIVSIYNRRIQVPSRKMKLFIIFSRTCSFFLW